MELNRQELAWVNNAINEVLHGPSAIDDWEFAARIGGERAEVIQLLRRIKASMVHAEPDN